MDTSRVSPPLSSAPCACVHMCEHKPVSRLHLLIVVLGAGHLVAIDGDSSNFSATGGGNGPHGPAHATANIQALLAGPELQQRSQTSLMRGLRRCPVLAGEAWREVEALQAQQAFNACMHPCSRTGRRQYGSSASTAASSHACSAAESR